MAQRRDRLSVRIPRLLEAQAEGPLAILALVFVVVVIVGARAFGWW